jgi:hypothetical protein
LGRELRRLTKNEKKFPIWWYGSCRDPNDQLANASNVEPQDITSAEMPAGEERVRSAIRGNPTSKNQFVKMAPFAFHSRWQWDAVISLQY